MGVCSTTSGGTTKHQQNCAAPLRVALTARCCISPSCSSGVRKRRADACDAARAAFERASALYPNAQSPRLALSQIARRDGRSRERRSASFRRLRSCPMTNASGRIRGGSTTTSADCAVSCCRAGAVQARPRRQTFTSRIEAVRVDVLVTENGRPVQGLTPDDFEVLDNGVRQRVDLASFEQIPLNVVLALDMSASLQGLRLGHLQTAGKQRARRIEAGRSRRARRLQPRRCAEPGAHRKSRSRSRGARSGAGTRG